MHLHSYVVGWHRITITNQWDKAVTSSNVSLLQYQNIFHHQTFCLMITTTRQFARQQVGWIVSQCVSWLVGQLTSWLFGWLTGQMVVGCLVGYLVLSIIWLAGWLAGLIEYLISQLISWLVYWILLLFPQENVSRTGLHIAWIYSHLTKLNCTLSKTDYRFKLLFKTLTLIQRYSPNYSQLHLHCRALTVCPSLAHSCQQQWHRVMSETS